MAAAAGVEEGADSRAKSLCSSLAMRVCNLLIELPELAKAVEKSDMVSVEVRERSEN